LNQGLRTVRLEANLQRIAEGLIALGTGAVLYFGVDRVLTGILTPGDLIVFTSYLGSMYRPLRRIARVSSRLSKAVASSERVFEVLHADEQVRVRRDAVAAPIFSGRVSFREVAFSYVEGRPILCDLSFRAKPGQTIALVGPNGAGKSTICGLIPRLFDPDSGAVYFDGEKASQYTLESLRQQLGIVLQEPLLFAGTVRDNICYGKPDASIEEVREAACCAGADGFIEALADSYDTLIGERGATLSVGQRQKIAIARAMVKHPTILILDEPTASLDPDSARRLNETLALVSQGRTTFRVSHRLAEVCDASQILVIEHGRIVEQGKHEELMSNGLWYRDTYELQQAEGASPAIASVPPMLAGASRG